jgi:hypothetical protein
MAVSNMAVIGKIPGYNINIDSQKEFEKNLLKGITFIDLLPMSYKANAEVSGSSIQSVLNNLEKVFNSPGIFTQDSSVASSMFTAVLKRMQESFGLDNSFSEGIKGLRIIAANDSTFTETLTNDYGAGNSLVAMAKDLFNGASQRFVPDEVVKAVGIAQKGMQGYSHAEMIQLAGNAYQILNEGAGGTHAPAGLADILTGAFFGMSFAAPSMWAGSSYQSNLTCFVKLVAPVGTPECIQKNILEPILYLLAASSPLTAFGSMYGFPLLWQIQAKGITEFRLGGIASMSVIRGSFETTFNHLLQPTVVDVRLNIVPMLNDFAVQTNISGVKSIYKERQYLAAQNPADLRAGLLNKDAVNQDDIVNIKL